MRVASTERPGERVECGNWCVEIFLWLRACVCACVRVFVSPGVGVVSEGEESSSCLRPLLRVMSITFYRDEEDNAERELKEKKRENINFADPTHWTG